MSSGKFVTAVNCMDGRTQLSVNEYMRKKYGVDYVDTVTETGPDKILAEEGPKSESIRERVDISVKKHGSKAIAIVAHYDCAGNPVDKETHLRHIKKAAETLKKWLPDVEVIGLWVGEDWKAGKVA